MKPQAAGGTKGAEEGPLLTFLRSLPYSLLTPAHWPVLRCAAIPSPKKYWEMYFGLLCVQLESWILEEENKGISSPLRIFSSLLVLNLWIPWWRFNSIDIYCTFTVGRLWIIRLNHSLGMNATGIWACGLSFSLAVAFLSGYKQVAYNWQGWNLKDEKEPVMKSCRERQFFMS